MGSNAGTKSKQKSVTGTFQFERPTKNKRVFGETGKRQFVGSQYITKEISKKLGDPDKIRVTIEAIG